MSSFWHKLAKIVTAGSKIGDPVSAALRKQGGALGTVGSIINPGAAASEKFSSGAPINARNMLDPNGWATQQPIPPEAPPTPLPSIGSIGPLPQGLQRRAVPYSMPPPGAGQFTQLAYSMAGPPPPNPPGATPFTPPPPGPPMSGVPGGIDQHIGLPPDPSRLNALGLPMTDPLALARMRIY